MVETVFITGLNMVLSLVTTYFSQFELEDVFHCKLLIKPEAFLAELLGREYQYYLL